MDERKLSALIGTIYDASTNVLSWTELGDQLCAYLAAERVYLGIPQPDGTLPNLLRAPDPFDASYSEHYHKADPFRINAAAAARRKLIAPYVIRGEHMSPKSEFVRSEYYADYARRRGTRHSLGAQIDTQGQILMGVFRVSNIGPFAPQDLQRLELLLPHLMRGLQLSRTLTTVRPHAGAGLAALDALLLSVVVVDAAMRVVFANPAAERLAAEPGSGLRIVRSSVASGNGQCILLPSHGRDAAALKALVAAAVENGPGGALRLQPSHAADADAGTVAVLVSPLPARLATMASGDPGKGRVSGLAMVIARTLMNTAGPSARLLSELFGLSPSEAAVATLILGGATAEHVARIRAVSLDTVRRQIQVVLRKTAASNLRDFERMAASLALMQPQASNAALAAKAVDASPGVQVIVRGPRAFR